MSFASDMARDVMAAHMQVIEQALRKMLQRWTKDDLVVVRVLPLPPGVLLRDLIALRDGDRGTVLYIVETTLGDGGGASRGWVPEDEQVIALR